MVGEKVSTLKAVNTFKVSRTSFATPKPKKTDLTPKEAAAMTLGMKTILGTQMANVLVE